MAFEEIEVQGRCSSPHIVKYYDSFIDNDSNINIVMEYCEHGDLHTYLENQKRYISEIKVWKYFIQLTLGIDHMHTLGIFHRDLKSLNVFLDHKFNMKIGDLGEASMIKNDQGEGGKYTYVRNF